MTELRLALAMRGGVSLAVWMGGACAEIDALRRARPRAASDAAQQPPGPDVDGFWAQVLAVGRYEGAKVDVLSGASAGGLNGALLAASIMYDVPFRYRDTWLTVGDLGRLIHGGEPPSDESPADRREREEVERRRRKRPPSLLRGDYFLQELRDTLTRTIGDRAPTGAYLDLTLTATVVEALPIPDVDDLGATTMEPGHRASFRFRSHPGTTDFPEATPAQRQQDLNAGVAAKLALAGRASASFPAAFEPVPVTVRRPRRVGARSSAQDGAEDLFGQFSDASRSSDHQREGTYQLIDGGALDNIPMGHAIQAVAASSADRATERFLLYLDPSPPPPRRDAPAPVEDLIGAVGATVKAIGSAESVLDDLNDLKRNNDAAFRYRALQRTLATTLPTSADADTIAAANHQRATVTARRIATLLTDPVGAIGEDPFTSDAQARPLLDSGRETLLLPAEVRSLEDAIERALDRRLPDTLPADVRGILGVYGPETPLHLALALLELAQHVERHATSFAARSTASATKEALYRVSEVAGLLVHILELFWPVHTAAHPPERDGDEPWGDWVADALAQRDALLAAAAVPSQVDALPGRWEPFTDLVNELVQRRAALAQDAPDGLLHLLWAHLETAAEQLAAQLSGAPPPDGDADQVPPITTVLREAGGDLVRALLTYEVLTQQLQTIVPRPPLPMRYARISSAQRSPASDTLFHAELEPATKLNGNEVANFAAFYATSWRANDWMWGRLDAAAALVDLVARPDRLRDVLGQTDRTALCTALKHAVLAPFEGDPPSAAWQAHLEGLWDDHEERIGEELDALARGDEREQLTATRAVLARRRQLEILRQELPVVLEHLDRRQLRQVVKALDGRRRSAGALAEDVVAKPEALLDLCKRAYRVGDDSLRRRRGSPEYVRRLTMLLLIGWRATSTSPRSPGWFGSLTPVIAVSRRVAVVSAVVRDLPPGRLWVRLRHRARRERPPR